MEYDVVVIGGGTAGYVAGSILARRNKRVLVIEKNKFGGVCVNSGCVPSIFLFDATFLLSRLNEIGNYLGIDVSAEITPSLFSKRNDIVEYLSDTGRKLVENSGAETIIGEAKIISRNEIKLDSKIIKFKKLVIATGTKAKIPNIEGIENAISEDEAVNLNCKPSSMIIVGGGYAGVEIAQFFSRLGTDVTLLSKSRLLRAFPDEARSAIKESLEFDGVNVVENVNIERIYGEKVYTNKGIFKGEIIVYATGRKPQLPEGIEKLNLNINSNGIVVDEYMNAGENVYAIGDVVDKERKTAHSAIFDAIISSLHILNDKITVRRNNFKIPQVIYTDPQVGIVGNIYEAKKFSTFPFNATTRSIINGLREGYVKIGINEENEVVFGEVIGNKAEELINILTIIVNSKMKVESLVLMPFVHPSLSEAIVNAAKGFFGLDVDNYKSENE